MQFAFSPANYNFSWTATWFEWDDKTARKQARADRDAKARELRAQGKKIIKWTLSNQLVQKGGINTGHPDIEVVVSVYMLDVL